MVLLLLTLLVATPALAQEPAEEFDVHFNLILDPRDTAPLEGEMVLATLRGEYRETITNEEVKLRPMTDFDWIQLAPDHWTRLQIAGLPTVVIERRIALFPKRAGTATILPVAHELEVMNRENVRQKILVRSAPVTIEVSAKPADAGSDWLPVRALELSESWSADPAKLIDGQNVQRRIVLRALGVPPELLPEQPPLREPWLINFTPPEERSVQVTSQGPVSTVVWVWTLRPITGEPGVIPQAVIPYFDTTDGQAKSIVIPPATIGYASFANNETAGWQTGFKANAQIAFGFLAGLGIAIPMTLRGMRFTSAPFRRLRRCIARQQRFAHFRRLERRGDVAGFRKAMADFLKSETTLNLEERLALTQRLDSLIFAADPPVRGDEMAVARRILRDF
ncbi:MAG: hypothetical protein ACKVKF_18385 [Rhodobacterales bacterium]